MYSCQQKTEHDWEVKIIKKLVSVASPVLGSFGGVSVTLSFSVRLSQ